MMPLGAWGATRWCGAGCQVPLPEYQAPACGRRASAPRYEPRQAHQRPPPTVSDSAGPTPRPQILIRGQRA